MTARTRITMLLTLAAALAVLAGCTKDQVPKEVLKYKVYKKQDLDLQGEFLYVPSTLSSNRHSSFGMAYSLGDERLVTLELKEFQLNVYSVEREESLAGNPSNRRLIFSVPVRHVDYRCQDDAFGECTSQEVENDRITWDKRKFVVPEFDKVKFAGVNFLPSDLPDECYKVTGTKYFEESESVTPTSINFRLERSYQNELFFFCNRGLSDLQDLNWTDVSHYSLVKLDTVASPDYKKAVYHPSWINTFGFFEQDDNHLDIDGNETQETETKYISRWNPNRSEVLYYLSPEFQKPQHATIRAATLESFKRINAGLQEAGVKFRLKVQDADASVNIGDLRNSMIVLAEDPFAMSVIGYGPAVVNPRTGEIISARTVMYLGTLQKFIRYTYDEILLAQKKEASAPAGGDASPASGEVQSLKSVGKNQLLTQKDVMKMLDLNNVVNVHPIAQVNRTPTLSEKDLERATQIAATRDQIMAMSKNNMYPAEMLDFGDVNQEVINQVVQKIGDLKPWETLTDVQRQQVLDVLTPYVWIPTLVHEMGHNLGLRHNFSGSEDKANFYSSQELKNLNVPVSTKNVPYSSIMDYPKSEINALRTFGKYDIAALKFGYLGKVADSGGAELKVDSSKPAVEGLKEFGYCSDEGVDPNPTCNPFDEGSSMVEIAQSLIDSYNDSFERSNFRRGRANFSSMDDDLYFSRVNRTFRKLRLIFERYYDVVLENNLTQADIDGIPFLKEMDEAVVLAADFMIDVILQPDTLCLVSTADGLQLLPIDGVPAFAHGNTRDCMKIELNDGFEMIGSGGKPLNSIKLPTNPNRYADQIDIRGTAIDRQVAMRTLFNRRLFSTLHDDNNSNFMDHPKVAPKLIKMVGDILNNSVTGNVTFNLIDGTSATIPVGFSLADRTYEVRAGELPIVNRVLGLTYDNHQLSETLVAILGNGLRQGAPSSSNLSLQRDLTVSTVNPGVPGVVSVQVGTRTLHATPQNRIAYGLVKKLQRTRLYEGATPESLQKIQTLLQKSEPLDTLTVDERAIAQEGLDPLTEFLGGSATPSAYFEPIVSNLVL